MKIGITGNIGSGKTTVCKIFESLNIPIYNADLEAKRLMVENNHVKEKIKLLFGLKAYHEDGTLNREFIGGIVFNNPQLLTKLNYIVHPAVGEDSLQWANSHKKAPYTLKEAALLYETEGHLSLDKIIVVSAPLDIRLERVMKRDQLDREAVMAREDKQMAQAKKVEMADFVIQNDGTQSLVKQVQKIHTELMALV